MLKLLLNRFELLNSHYRSDLNRLGSLSEAANKLSQFPEVACPICGTEGMTISEFNAEVDVNAVRAACQEEIRKIENSKPPAKCRERFRTAKVRS